ncbi:MAG TPA: hypothetical protein VN673_12620, partial [Clostridia bacterium]|nr:hypothetical protein [Clostridia bacterium]
TKEFAADLFHFGPQPRSLGAEFFLLNPGQYSIVLTEMDTGKKLETRMITVQGPRTTVQFQLPSRKLCALRVTPK